VTDRKLSTVVGGYTFLEGPRWHDGRLWPSDFYTHQVFTVTPEGKTEKIVTVPAQPSGLGWLPDGRLLAVSMKDRKLMREWRARRARRPLDHVGRTRQRHGRRRAGARLRRQLRVRPHGRRAFRTARSCASTSTAPSASWPKT
jgi:sugar lactone lactonase YvrE